MLYPDLKLLDTLASYSDDPMGFCRTMNAGYVRLAMLLFTLKDRIRKKAQYLTTSGSDRGMIGWRLNRAEITLTAALLDRNVHFQRETATKAGPVDFCFPDRRLIVEVDGSVHSKPKTKKKDKKKDRILTLLGWIVIRFTAKAVVKHTQQVINIITRYPSRPSNQ
jgi:very-short-patch-repair endonuclease